MPTYRTPCVYIQETSAFPPSVTEAPTAVAAFVGYTETAAHDGAPLGDKPFRVTSMPAFEAAFGGPPRPRFRVTALDGPAGADVVQALPGGEMRGYGLTRLSPGFGLYEAMQAFFMNGGGACWVVSVGGYEAATIEADALRRGVAALEAVAEPRLLVVPEAVALSAADCHALQAGMLAHAAAANRFAILDIHGGDRPRDGAGGDPVAAFRDAIGAEHLSDGAAYYPWVRMALGGRLTAADFEGDGVDVAALFASGPQLRDAAAVRPMPPAAAVAGVYARVDDSRGVWKAPANVDLSGAAAPVVAITDRNQGDLNTPVSGRAVNAIRSFAGKGVRVWGARTLDGNSHDWRYVSVRRTCQVIEESVRPALAALAFEPNQAATWAAARAMVDSYLVGLWRRGALMGAKPEHAFAVQCGLGQTMTQADLDAGRMRLMVMVALVRPAEFIVLSFQQQMQA